MLSHAAIPQKELAVLRRTMMLWLAASALAVPAGAQEASSEWVQRAEALVRDLEAGRYGDAAEKLAPEVRAQLDSAGLAAAWTQITTQVGALGALESRTDTLQQGMHLVEFDGAFERQALLVRIVMRDDGKVMGLWFLPPGSGGAEPAGTAQTEGPPYADPSRIEEAEVTVGAAPWALPGTLTLPAGESRVPVVVLVHGSGPHDRDETIGPNKPFRDLAWGLASRGVGVLRYEKRTKVHGARMGESVTVDEEVIEDAVAAIEVARVQPRTAGVYLAGHSLGGMLAPEIAVRAGELDGVILLAGATRGMAEMIEEQITYIASLPASSSPAAQAQLRAVLDTVALLKKGELPPTARAMGAPASYVYDLDARKPLERVREVTAPVVVLQGGRDYQVTEVDLERWRQALAGRPDVETRLYPDLNHLFIEGQGRATPQEYMRPGHVAEKVVADIAAWVKDGRLPAR